MLKKINETQLPEPFKTYWNSPDKLVRNWEFYMAGEELYILDVEGNSVFLQHWHDIACCGVQNFIRHNKISTAITHRIICQCGNSRFIILPKSYAIELVCPDCSRGEEYSF